MTVAHEFTMPKLGLTMTDGTIREWLVPEGTMVQAGDPVLIIETDKVETEVEAREAGVLTITGVVGENYECGAVIGHLASAGESAPATPAAAPAAVASETLARDAAAAPVKQPSVEPAPAAAPASVAVATASTGVDVAARGELDRILASPRARATARDLGVELEPIAGSGPDGRIVAPDVVAYAEALTRAAAAAPASASSDAASAVVSDVAARGEGGRILASPRARAAARDQGVELEHIAGSGPDGRIVADDVNEFATARATSPAPSQAAPASAAPASAAPAPAARAASVATAAPAVAGVAATGGARMLAELLGIDLRSVPAAPGTRVSREDVASWVRQQLAGNDVGAPAPAPTAEPPSAPLLQEPTELIPLRGMRGVIAERMHASLAEMAQLTLSVDADMTAINAERERCKQSGQTAPGYTAWVVAAAARSLVDHPYVNSQVTAAGVAYLPEVHVGVAVALDDGLIVPVIKRANTSAVGDVHGSVADLAAKARDGKLKLDELEGGTFSVTALGMYGVDMFTPVINPPNTAILGVGRLRTETRWTDGAPSPVTVMTLSLTWDHRAFDGAPAAEFAQSIVRYLEDPAPLLR